MTVIAIVQARMGSTRLPGKVMADLAGKPQIRLLLDRLARSRHIQKIVIATTSSPKDDPLARYLREAVMPSFGAMNGRGLTGTEGCTASVPLRW